MVTWSIPARGDLKQAYDYIARDSRYYAEKVATDIVEKSELLDGFPEIGRVVPEIGNPNIRELFVHSYRLIYEVSPNDVVVLGLIHGKQDFSAGNLDELRRQ